MKTTVVWKDRMEFDGQADHHVVAMDAKVPLGSGLAPTPKELVAMALGGCTAMDVIALLKKQKQTPDGLRVDVEVEASTGAYPVVFRKAHLSFVVEGEIDPHVLLEAVRLSQTQYCGVSAMLAVTMPITYEIVLNGELVGTGHADFEKPRERVS